MPRKQSNPPGRGPGRKAGGRPTDAASSEALWSALEADPTDRLVLLALADWFEEQGDVVAAECLRWGHARRKRPFQYFSTSKIRYHYEKWGEGWYWWARQPDVKLWQIPATCGLTNRLWKELAHTFDYDPVTFKEYRTRRGAYEALIEGWRRHATRPKAGDTP
jgi:uncharacterized protein (TIGR02996 family)